MNRHFKRWIVIIAGLFLIASLSWAQAPPAEKTPPSPEKKSEEKDAPPKKKMKKVKTLFGETWVEDNQAPEAAVPESTPSPQTPSAPATGAPPAAAPVTPPSSPTPAAAASTGAPPPEQTVKSSPDQEQEKGASKPPESPQKKKEAAPAAPAPPAATTPSLPPVSGASLVFNNADLIQVIHVIANLLRLNYILDPGVKGVVNITTVGDISSSDLMQILQTLLRINGATAIQTGNLWQMVPLKNARQIPIPLDRPGEKPLTPEDRLVTQIIPMQFVNAADMSKILKEFLSDAGSIVSHDRGNILIITEASRNMARLLELIRTFDSDALESQRVQFFQIKNNSARSMIEELKNVFAAYSLSDKESALRFVPIDRLNAILVVAPNPKSFEAVEEWINKLDQPAQIAGIRNYVYRLQYAKASALRGMLAELYGSVITREAPLAGRTTEPTGGAAASPTAGLSTSTVLSQARPHERETVQQQQERDLYGFQGNIKVVADDTNNMLIVQATPQDYDLLEQTLRQIDIMPRQVLIEAQVFSVDLSHDFSLGIEYFLQQRGKSSSIPVASFSQGSLTGSSVLFREGARELFTRVTASENRTRTKALSSPSILATDNQEARIQVGISIPTLSSSGFARTGSDALVNTISNVDTGVILSVTPHVNANGMVGMRINQEVSSPVPPPAGVPNISPSINRSAASTSFVVKDGDTVAIAGIITENKGLTRSRIPLLGDIPILGAAFGSTSVTSKRSELIIFITPHVVETLDDQKVTTEALRQEMKKLRKDIQANQKQNQETWEKARPGANSPLQ